MLLYLMALPQPASGTTRVLLDSISKQLLWTGGKNQPEPIDWAATQSRRSTREIFNDGGTLRPNRCERWQTLRSRKSSDERDLGVQTFVHAHKVPEPDIDGTPKAPALPPGCLLDVLVCASAGERGLDLQTAHRIVHYDLPWAPYGVIQRTGRVERIGADANRIAVAVPVMQGTIDERVASLGDRPRCRAGRALDQSHGAKAAATDPCRSLSGLVHMADEHSLAERKESAMLAITRELLAS